MSRSVRPARRRRFWVWRDGGADGRGGGKHQVAGVQGSSEAARMAGKQDMMHPTNDTLNEYIDRELDPPAVDKIEQHLAACASCSAVVTELAALRDAACTLGTIDP